MEAFRHRWEILFDTVTGASRITRKTSANLAGAELLLLNIALIPKTTRKIRGNTGRLDCVIH